MREREDRRVEWEESSRVTNDLPINFQQKKKYLNAPCIKEKYENTAFTYTNNQT